ncbi:hypothetical protein, partial [Klebsiella pneumoniae]|uniref:hypothetical protein n=1 Tax=Klebsiella pneumoniae TaxID=573 RepID=UPI003B982D66
YYTTGSHPMGWGNKILSCPIRIAGSGTATTNGNSEEGIRGEFDDLLYVHNSAPYQNGDIITHEGNQYVFTKPVGNIGYVGLYYTTTYLLKI